MSEPRPGADGGVDLLAWFPQRQRDPEFSSPDRVAAYAAELHRQAAGAALWMYEPDTEPAVRSLHQEVGVAVNPIVPNMRAYLRDASDHGVVGAAIQRFRRLGLLDQARIGLHQVRRVAGVLTRDFATGVLVMAEMELVRFRRYRPTMAILDASVTDLALALDNAALLSGFVSLAEASYGLTGGLATYNYGVLVERLRAWGIRPGLIVAPFNPRGYLMNPSREACERAVAVSETPVVASHIEVDGVVARGDALDYLRARGLRRAVVDLLR